MLELKDICFKRNNKNILNKINLKVNTNKCIVITGPNGSGKSTLAKIIMGIEKPDSGNIIFNGIDITNMSINERAKLKISFAFQQPVRFKGISVSDLIRLASGKRMNKQEVAELITKVGLNSDEYINRDVDAKLSGGELKRIEIASVLAKESELTIFDEPEAGIDIWSFNNLIDLFKERKRNKESLIIISHQQRLFNIADEIILIEKGQVKMHDSFSNMKEILCDSNGCCKKRCNNGQ